MLTGRVKSAHPVRATSARCWAWLADLLARIADHKITDLAALLPWNYVTGERRETRWSSLSVGRPAISQRRELRFRARADACAHYGKRSRLFVPFWQSGLCAKPPGMSRRPSQTGPCGIFSFPKIPCALGFAPASFAPLKLALNGRAHEVGSILVLLKHIGDAPERSLAEPSHHILIPALLSAHASWRT